MAPSCLLCHCDFAFTRQLQLNFEDSSHFSLSQSLNPQSSPLDRKDLLACSFLPLRDWGGQRGQGRGSGEVWPRQTRSKALFARGSLHGQ